MTETTEAKKIMTFDVMKQYIAQTLEDENMTAETDGEGISVSFTGIGLSGIWAKIDHEEIQYAVENCTDQDEIDEIYEAIKE